MPNLWFPIEELISDRVERGQKLWDERVGKQTIKAGAAQIAEPMVQDRIGSALSRFDTLTAGPARGLLSGLSGPMGPLTAANPIAAGSAIGSDLFPKMEPGIRKGLSDIDQRLATPEPTRTPRKPIETPGLGLAPLGAGIEDRLTRATSKFDSLLGDLGTKASGLGAKRQLMADDINRSVGMPTTRAEADERFKDRDVPEFTLDPRENWLTRGAKSAVNEVAVEPYNRWAASPEARAKTMEGLGEIGKIVGSGMTLSGESTLPTSRKQAPRVAETRTAVKDLDPEKAMRGVEALGDISNVIPGLAGVDDVFQNIATPFAVEGLKEVGVPEPYASGLGVLATILGPMAAPLAKRGVIRVNANAEQLIGQQLPGGSLAPAITSAEKSRMGAMQQINWMKTGVRKDGVTPAFPFEYDTTKVRNTKSGRPVEYASSSTELEAMIRLERNNDVESWRRPDDAADIIPYRMDNGETGSYVPDFIVKYKDGRTEVIEIKAAFREEQPGVKARSKAAQQWAADRGYEYALVTERELGEASLRARAKEDPSLFVGLSPHMAEKFQALIERSSISAGKYAPRAFDPERTLSVGLTGRAQPPSARGRAKPQPLTEADLEVLELIRDQQLNAGNTQGAERTLGLITDTRARLGIEGPRGTSADLDYPEPVPDDPETIKYNEREAGKLFLKGTALRSGIGATTGSAGAAAYSEDKDMTPGERAAFIAAGGLAGGAVGAGVHATGYKGLATLIDTGKVNKQYLQGHPDLANRVRAIMLAAAERTPAGQPVEVPVAVRSLERLSTGNGLEGLTPELLRLTSGQLTAEQIRDAIGRATPLSKVKQAAKDLLADAVSGIPTRFNRAEEYRADKSALYNLKGVGIERATSVEDLVRRVADAVGTATPVVKIIDSPDVNAFAPVNGQPLGLTSGLMNLGLSREELGWIIAHELMHTTPQGRSKRMKWLVSRAVEKGGKAEGQASGGLAERFSRHKVLMEGRLSQYDQLTTRMAAARQGYETRRMQIEMRKASNGIQRPPSEGVWAEWGGTFTDNDLMEIAARSGDVQSFGPQWWEAVDPRVVREYKAEVMSERGTRKVPPRTMKSYSDEMDAIERQKNQLEQQLEEDMNISSNLEEQAANEGVDLTLDDEIEAPSADYDDMGASAPDPNRFARPIEGTDAGPITEPEPVAKQELPARKAEQNALDLGELSVTPKTAPLVDPNRQTQLGMGLDVPKAPPKMTGADRAQDAARAARGVEQAPIDLAGPSPQDLERAPLSQIPDDELEFQGVQRVQGRNQTVGERVQAFLDLAREVRARQADGRLTREQADAMLTQIGNVAASHTREPDAQRFVRQKVDAAIQQGTTVQPTLPGGGDTPSTGGQGWVIQSDVPGERLSVRHDDTGYTAELRKNPTGQKPWAVSIVRDASDPGYPEQPNAGGQMKRGLYVRGGSFATEAEARRFLDEEAARYAAAGPWPDRPSARPQQGAMDLAGVEQAPPRTPSAAPERNVRHPGEVKADADTLFDELEPEVERGNLSPQQVHARLHRHLLAGDISDTEMTRIKEGLKPAYDRAPPPATITDSSVTTPSGPRTESQETAYNRVIADIEDAQTKKDPGTISQTIKYHGFSAEDQADLHAQLAQKLEELERAGVPPYLDGKRIDYLVKQYGPKIKRGTMTVEQAAGQLKAMLDRGEIGPQTYATAHFRLENDHNTYLAGKRKAAIKAGKPDTTGEGTWGDDAPAQRAEAPPAPTAEPETPATPEPQTADEFTPVERPQRPSWESDHRQAGDLIAEAAAMLERGASHDDIRDAVRAGVRAGEIGDATSRSVLERVTRMLENREKGLPLLPGPPNPPNDTHLQDLLDGLPTRPEGMQATWADSIFDDFVDRFEADEFRSEFAMRQSMEDEVMRAYDNGEISLETRQDALDRIAARDYPQPFARELAEEAPAPAAPTATPEPETAPAPEPVPEPAPAPTPEPEAPAAPAAPRFKPEEVAQSKQDIQQAVDDGVITTDEANAKLDEMVRTGELDQADADAIRPDPVPHFMRAPEPEAPEAPAPAAAAPSGDAAAAQARSAARAAEFGSTSDFNPETYQRLMDEYGPQLERGENFIEGIEKDLARREAAGEVDYDTAKEVVEDLRRQNGLPTDTTVPETPDQAAAPEVDPIPEEAGTVEALPEIEPIPAEPERPDMTLRPQTQSLPDAPDTASDIGTMLPPEPEVPPTPAPAPAARAPREERGPGKKALRNQVQQHVDQMLDSDEMTPDEIRQAITDMADAGTITDWQAIEAQSYLDKQLNMRAVNGQPETGPIPGQINAAMGRQLDRRTPPPVERRGKAPKEPEEPVVFESGEEGAAGYGDVTTNRPDEAPPREVGRAQTPDEFAAQQNAEVQQVLDETREMSMEDALAHIDDKTASGEISQTVGNRAAAQIYDRAGQAPPVPTPEPEPVRHPDAPEDYPAGAPYPPPESGRPKPEVYPSGPEGAAGYGDVTKPPVTEPDQVPRREPGRAQTDEEIRAEQEDELYDVLDNLDEDLTVEEASADIMRRVEAGEITPSVGQMAINRLEGKPAVSPFSDFPPVADRTPPPPPSGPGGGTPPPEPPGPPDPKGPRPPADRWPAGEPWPPKNVSKDPTKWRQFWQKLDSARYSTNMLFSPAGGFRDLLGTLTFLSLTHPRTAIASGFEDIAQAFGGVKLRERSAVRGQSREMTKAWAEGLRRGKAAASDVWQKGTESRFTSTPDAPNTNLFGTQTKFQRGLSRGVESGYRVRLASDAFNAQLGEEVVTTGLAYREAVRAGLKRGTDEFKQFQALTQRNLKTEMYRQAQEAYDAGGKVTQGPTRPRAMDKPAPPGVPQEMADTDIQGLAQEAFAMAKSLIFQGAQGTSAKAVSDLASGAIRGPVPFFTTLSNIGAQWVEHHPLTGAAGTLTDIVRSGAGSGPYAKGVGPNAGNRFTSSSSAAVRPASQRLASATMGAGVAAAAFGLAMNNLLTDNGPSDTSVRRKMLDEGWRPNAIPIPDLQGGTAGYLPMEWFLGPLAGAASFGTAQARRVKRGEEINAKEWGKILLEQSSQWGGASGFRPIYDIVNAFQAPDATERLRSFEDILKDTFGGSIPAGGLVKIVRDFTGDEFERDPRSLEEYIQSLIPGLNQDLPYKRNEFGGAIERPGLLTRVGRQVLPTTISEARGGRRAFSGSSGPEQDAEATAAINAVDNYNRRPSEYKAPTNRQRSLAATFRGHEDAWSEYSRSQESAARRRRRASSNSIVEDILTGNWGALGAAVGIGGGGGTGGGSDQFVPPTSASRPRFQIPRFGG